MKAKLKPRERKKEREPTGVEGERINDSVVY